MDIKNVLISLRDDLMKWTTNNIKALQATIPSADDFATPEYVDEKLEDIDLTSYVKTVNGVSPNENGNVNITAGVSVGPDEPTDNSVIWIDTDEETEELQVATLNTLTLGIHADGMLYIFSDNQPVGRGVQLGSSDAPILGYVDSENNVVLSGNLYNGNYTIKYETEDGTLIDIGSLTLEELESPPTVEPEEPGEEVSSRLPSEYQEVEWVQIVNESGTDVWSCIHTNIKWNETNKIVAKIQHLVSTDANDIIFAGWESMSMKAAPYIATRTSKSQVVFGYNSGLTSFAVSPSIATPPSVEEANTYTFTFTSTSNADISVGCWNDMEYSNCHKFYYIAFYNNDTLIGEFIPCYRKSDSINGFYDTVGKLFYVDADTNSIFQYRGNDCTNAETPTETNYFDIKTALLNHRLDSTGKPSAFNGMIVTDYIPVNSAMYGQRFWINGMTLITSSNYNYNVRTIYYDTSKTMVEQSNYTGAVNEYSYYINSVPDESFTEGYIRISLVLKDNEELSESDVSNLTILLR